MKSAVMAACAALMIPMMSVMAQATKPAAKPPAAPKPLPVVTPEAVTQLETLIGNALRAKPAKARKVLVFSKCEGFVHGEGIVYGNKAPPVRHWFCRCCLCSRWM